MNHIHEECGVFGIYSPNQAELASDCYYALFDLGMAYISADRTEVARDAQKGIDMLKQARTIATGKGDTAFVLLVDKMIN